jgi:hypothetical protein
LWILKILDKIRNSHYVGKRMIKKITREDTENNTEGQAQIFLWLRKIL